MGGLVIVTHMSILSPPMYSTVCLPVCIYLPFFPYVCMYIWLTLVVFKPIFNDLFKAYCLGLGTVLLELQSAQEQSVVVTALDQKQSKFKWIPYAAQIVIRGTCWQADNKTYWTQYAPTK